MDRSKEQMSAVILLMAKCPWLADRAEALAYLQAECASDAELSLVFNLLERFDYLEEKTLSIGFQAMVNQVVNVWNLVPAQTIICPPKVDSGSDSGPAVVQVFKSILGKQKIRGIELLISLNKLKDHAKIRNVVVLVDEFAGTGKTIDNKLKVIRELPAYKESPPKIFVCLLAAARMARDTIEPKVDGYFAWREYPKGISDHFSEPALTEAKSTMEGIENKFAPIVRGENLPRFGYGGTEVLMGWDSNLPNSVFPLFWWPESQAPKGERTTLFSRYF